MKTSTDVPLIMDVAINGAMYEMHEFLDKHLLSVCMTKEEVIALDIPEHSRQTLMIFINSVYRCDCGKIFLRF